MSLTALLQARKVLAGMQTSKFTVLLENRICACEVASCLGQPLAALRKKPLEVRQQYVATLKLIEDIGWPLNVQTNLLCLGAEQKMKAIAQASTEADVVEACKDFWKVWLPLKALVGDDADGFVPEEPNAYIVLAAIRDQAAAQKQAAEKTYPEIEEFITDNEGFLMDALLQKASTHGRVRALTCVLLELLADTETFAEFEEEQSPFVKPVLARVLDFCKALVVLLCPESGKLGATVADLAQ